MISTEHLRRYPHFAGVSEQSLKAVAAISEEQTHETGETLFEEGQDANHLYIVTEGEVDIQYSLASGQHVIVDTLVSGDLLAWSAVVAPYEMTATGVARKNVHLIAIKADKLRTLLDNDPVLGHVLMRHVASVVSKRLEGARVQLATTS